MNRLHFFCLVACIPFFFNDVVNSQIINPRAWAEWEETDGIILHQPNFYPEEAPSPLELLIAEEWDSLYLDLVRGLQDEGVKIYYIIDTNDRPEYHSAILDTMCLKYGINIYHPDFHIVIGCREDYSYLTKWTRDHGPMNVYKNGTDTLYFYLFKDDVKGAGGILRDYLGMPDTVFTYTTSGGTSSDGGNYIVDGYSMGMINGGTGAVLPALKEYFGLDTVYALPDYLVHADYYMKMVNEETMILSKQVPQNYIYGTEPYTYQQDSAILSGFLAFFQEQVISQYGRPLKVYQVLNPPSVQDDSLKLWWYTHHASYTNSLIVNRSVFVPQFNTPESDSMALEMYSQAMPGYKVIPVFSRRGATGGGAVHCLTNSVAADDPVLIRHAWYCDTAEVAPGYEISAQILTRSGVKDATVLWSQGPEGPFQPETMQLVSEGLYSATITRPEGATDIYYYITAGSKSGKIGIKPMVAPEYTYHIIIKSGAPGWISHLTKGHGTVHIYPNPATDHLKVDLKDHDIISAERFWLDIYDNLGRTVYHRQASEMGGTVEIHVGNLAPGQYFLVLVYETGQFYSTKFMIIAS